MTMFQYTSEDGNSRADNGNFDPNFETLYPVFPFEKVVYLYVWETLVFVACLLNTIVIVLLLRRTLRNTTNVILSAIAVTDSLTGLVTLPSYVAVFNNQYSEPKPTDFNVEYFNYYNVTEVTADVEVPDVKTIVLPTSLCRSFMLSKFFISHSFHTASVWLSLLLAVHRFVFISFPSRAKSLFSIRYTVSICVIIILCSPSLHVFHLFDDKAKSIICQWDRETNRCGPGCVYIGMMFSLRHFIPAILLALFTSMFIHELVTTRHYNVQESNISPDLVVTKKQADASQQATLIVIAVLGVFLIPEVPYGVFLLYSIISWQTIGQVSLQTNRVVQTIYEITMMIAFATNFAIYVVLNKAFRKELFQVVSKIASPMMSSTNASGTGRIKSNSSFSNGSIGGEENAGVMHDSDIELEMRDYKSAKDNTEKAEQL